jgi:hypothetical protein
MAIQTIARLQNRRGLYADLPTSLAEGELGWCLDTRQLFIGNSEGYGGNSEVLTEYSQNDQVITTIYSTAGVELLSAISRTLHAKLDDIASIKDFGAVGDGVTDDAPAINAAISQLLTGYPESGNTAVSLFFPAGTYLINSPILLYPFLNIVGDGANGTTILAAAGTSMQYMLQTVDGLGQTEANIGFGGAVLPTKIYVSDINIDTNGQKISAVRLIRYSHVRYERVYITGGWVTGNSVGTDSAFTCESIGNAVYTHDAQFIDCDIKGFTYAILINDPVAYTTISRCNFHVLYKGIAVGVTPTYNGPYYTTVTQTRFYTISNYGIYVGNDSSNPGVTSISNTFDNVGSLNSVKSVYWGTLSTINGSIGDVFSIAPGVDDYGTTNIIMDAQQNNLSGGSLPSRTLVSVTSASLAAGASADLALTGFKGYALYSIQVSYGAWVTVYTSTSARTADAGRTIVQDPTPDSGVIGEIITTTSGTKYFSPAVIGYSSEVSPTTSIPIKLYNNDTASQLITVTLSIVQLEA